ncbi:putative multidrug export ATP-binding/permease protein [bacterium BMS3Abin02]|nr:putative multidrug export ATP-binding/permease protein [bacterium BMS3Abin02]GBE22545.1 putative multidrug export ATP-binding/permease protein [bacterium BMS3Bbin01]
MSSTLRDPAVKTGLSLLGRTLLQYRKASALSIGSALLWMSMVAVVPYLTKLVVDRVIEGKQSDLLVPLFWLIVAAGFLKALGIGGRRFFAFSLSYRAETDLRNRLFEHVQRLAFSFHDRVSTGELMARASSDLSQVRLIFAMMPITIANVALTVIVIVALIALDPVLGVIASLSVPALYLLANRYAGRILGVSWDVQQKLADLSRVVEEVVAGVRVVKSYGQEEQVVDRLSRSADRIFGRTMEMLRLRSVYVPMFEMIPALGTAAVLAVGGTRVVSGVMTLGDFVAFTQYMAVLMFPLRITGWFFAELPRSAAAASRVTELLKTGPDIQTPERPAPLPDGQGALRFSHVSFAYPDGSAVLRDVDLTIPAGTSVALVGSTGSGKTTFAYLLPRFYDPDSGSILLDGTDISTLRIDDLRSQVALVFEEPFLFSASIAENIAFGAPDATDEQVRLAARLAQANEFICRLPDGYDTVVGERGYSLSGGQRQRIALARAILRDPRVLILDDATSSVDAVTEMEIRQALEEVMAGRTTIIIAHRTSSLTLADRVVLLDDGEIVASGTHEQLLAESPRYREVLAETGVIPKGTAP